MLSNVTNFCQSYGALKCLKIVSNYICLLMIMKWYYCKYRELKVKNKMPTLF
jgi:hypothetical protein